MEAGLPVWENNTSWGDIIEHTPLLENDATWNNWIAPWESSAFCSTCWVGYGHVVGPSYTKQAEYLPSSAHCAAPVTL